MLENFTAIPTMSLLHKFGITSCGEHMESDEKDEDSSSLNHRVRVM